MQPDDITPNSQFPSPEKANISRISSEQSSYKMIFLDQKNAFQCLFPDCHKIFRFKSDVERHITVHSDARPFPCTHPKCKKTFKRADALKNHLHSHNDFSFTCSVTGCEAKFKKRAELQCHLLEHPPQTFTCSRSDCQKTFTTLKNLMKHQTEGCNPEKISLQSEIEIKEISSKSETEKKEVFQSVAPSDVPEFPNFEFEEFSESPRLNKWLHSEEGKNRLSTRLSNSEEKSKDINEENQELFKKMFGYLQKENKELNEKLADILSKLKNELIDSKCPLKIDP